MHESSDASTLERTLVRRTGSRILVTGGAGFIGARLVRSLTERGHRVRVLDDLSGANVCRGSRRGDEIERQGVEWHRGSVTDRSLVARALDGCDTVVHLAAVVGVRRVLADPERTLRINWEGARIVATEAARRDVRLLYASSSEVLGVGARGIGSGSGDEVARMDETLPPLDDVGPSARWSYAIAKLAGERLVHELCSGPARLRARTVRFFNTTGPGQSPSSGMVLPVLVARGLAGFPLEVHGSGEQVRSFCHVDDTVRALVGLLESERPSWDGGIHHVGSEVPVTVAELARRVSTRLSAPVVRVPYASAFGAGFEDVRHRVPDTSRLRADIGWSPRIGLDALIGDVIDAQRSGTARPAANTVSAVRSPAALQRAAP